MIKIRKPYILMTKLERAEYEAYEREAIHLAQERGKQKAKKEYGKK